MVREGYVGTYIPNSVSHAQKHNKELESGPAISGLRKLNIASMIIANGLSDPYVQFAALGGWLCEGPYVIFEDLNSPQCISWTRQARVCAKWT